MLDKLNITFPCAELGYCPHGLEFCPYKNRDADVCIACLQGVIKHFRRCINRLRKEGEDDGK